MSSKFAPVTTRRPCARCGHDSWCLASRDGSAVMCMRDLVGFDGATREMVDGTPYGYHWTGAGSAPTDAPPAPKGIACAPPEVRNRAYRAMLDSFELSEQHRQHLRHRGLSPDQVAALTLAGYRTLPDYHERARAIRAAIDSLGGGDPLAIPGLHRGNSSWRLAGRPGLLIPVRDVAGRIVACKIRPDDPGPDGAKYVWLSSTAHDGASPGAPAHVAAIRTTTGSTALRIVEGVLKADIAAALDPSCSVVGIPSCTAISTARDAMAAIAPGRVLLAWDGDAEVNPHVARGLARAVEVVREVLPGASIAAETWDRAHKGVDDALAAGAAIATREDAAEHAAELIARADAAEAARKAAKVVAALAPAEAPEATDTPPAAPVPTGTFRALSDLGNAERLADACRDKLRWVDGLEWLVWDGQRWKRDTSYEVQRLAVAAIRGIVREINSHPAGADRTAKHALKSESANGIANALKLLRGLPGIAHPVGDFDRDPWLLNCENGTIDLRTGTLRAHDPADLITKLAPVAWDPGAAAPEFGAFLARVQPDADVRGYLQRLAGYAATGVIREHVFPIWYGSGRNGKGTLTDAVRAALGDYATDIPAEMLTVRKNDAHPTERMCLLGARFASASETEGNTALAVAFVKRATGGDPITARHMGKDFVTFDPTHKIVLSTNNRPRIREGSDAIWRRVHLVPWEVQIPDGEVDAGLRDRLREDHRAAVLRWIVDGCLAWQRQGLAPPARVVAATRAYREDSEPDVLAFLRERCVLESEARISRKELLGALNGWLAEDGSEPVSAKLLGDYVAENAAALRVTRTTYGPVKVFKGVRLKTSAELTADAHEPDDRAHETSGSWIGLKTQVPANADDSDAMSPMSPIHPSHTHMHAPAQAHAPALRTHTQGAPTWNRSGSSGSSDLSARNESRFSMSPIESANRAHRAQAAESDETAESMDAAAPLDDGNGHLWADA